MVFVILYYISSHLFLWLTDYNKTVVDTLSLRFGNHIYIYMKMFLN